MDRHPSVEFADAVIGSLRGARSQDELAFLLDSVARGMGFKFYALAHHDDPHKDRDRVQLLRYPTAITDRLVEQHRYRRDPVVRGCIFADSAFLWSDLPGIITLDRRDRESFARGAREGLNEGITVPFVHLGEAIGSCTFAGTHQPDTAARYLGVAQMIGIFAFQAARRLVATGSRVPARLPRLHPRPRDCIVLAGRGYSNKEIARALSITPRTVDGYLTEARRLFAAHDRTELVVSAVLAGEIGIHELRRRQPE